MKKNMNDYAVRLLAKMLEIYSPSEKEEEISNFLLSEMENLGFHAWKDEVGNVIGEIGEGEISVLLCGHMDTVPGYIPVRIEDNRLYGRGAVDAKAPLAAMIVASSALAKKGLSSRILVVGVVEEEGKSRGIKHFIKQGTAPDYAIFGEPSGVENIIIGYKGSLHLKITCETETGHSAAPWLFENAVEKAFEIWEAIKNLHLPQEKLDSRFYSITSCLTKITGGEESSIVPAKCDIHVDIRIPPQLTTQEVFDEAKRVISQYQTAHPKVKVEVTVEDLADPFEIDSRSPIVRALSWSIRKVRHKPATLLRKTGTGDMNVLSGAMKIPILTYGPGNSHLDHTANEHIDIQEYLDSIQILQETILRLIELHKTKKQPSETG
jgi:LysW-gamma-L-lysine carboxypeptidase